MAEPIYIPYGLEEIDSNALNEALANEYQNYLNSRVWTKGKKGLARAQLWMDAYNEIMNRGITGASVENGLWRINHNGENFLYTDDPRKLEIYEDVASFINDLMKKLPTRKSLEEKKEDKKKTKYDFISNFQLDFLNRYYGNNPNLYKSEWFELDPRGEKGIRGTEKRRNRLIEALTKYRDESLKDEYDYEGTPFSGYDDVKSRITEAINALQSPRTDDDLPALNKLGINYRALMNNGANDVYDIDSEGNSVTYLQYYDNLQKIADAKNKAKKQANYNNTLFINRVTNSKMLGLNALSLKTKYKDHNSLFKALLAYSLKDIRTLSPDELSEVLGAYRYLAKDPIDNNLLKRIQNSSSGLYKGSAPNRFRKIKGIDNLIWDDDRGQVIQINTRLLQLAILNLPTDLFSGILTLQEKLQNPRQLSEGLLYEDYARIGAALGDIVSLGGFGANIAGSIVSLLGDTTADIADDRVSTWEAVKNFGKNLGWTAAGFIPGAKLGKVAKNIMRWAPKMLVVLNNYNLLNDESNKNTWNKLTNESRLLKEGLTDEDLKNITYWARAFTGNINAAKATARDIKYSRARGTAGLEFITKDGTKVTLSNKDVLEINVAGARKGQKAAEDLFKSKTGKDVADNTFKFSENGRKGIFKNTRSMLQDLLLQGKSTVFRNPEQLRYYDLLNLDRNLGGLGGWRWLGSRGTSSYFGHFDNGFSFRNPLRGKLDPYRNIIFSPTVLHGNLPLPSEPILNIRKPIPVLGPYYRKLGGTINKLDTIIEDFFKKNNI